MTPEKREQLKEVAVRRLEYLTKFKGLESSVVTYFKKDSQMMWSERIPLGRTSFGILYWGNESGGFPEEIAKEVKRLEEMDNILVYHATHEYAEFGELWDLWCVSEEDLEYGDDDFKEGYQFAYVVNVTEPLFSEYGTILYRVSGGGCIRIG